jgi:hypothetical protein
MLSTVADRTPPLRARQQLLRKPLKSSLFCPVLDNLVPAIRLHSEMAFELKIRRKDNDWLSLSVEAGTPLFVLGANGSGKSTLLHDLFNQHFAQAKP